MSYSPPEGEGECYWYCRMEKVGDLTVVTQSQVNVLVLVWNMGEIGRIDFVDGTSDLWDSLSLKANFSKDGEPSTFSQDGLCRIVRKDEADHFTAQGSKQLWRFRYMSGTSVVIGEYCLWLARYVVGVLEVIGQKKTKSFRLLDVARRVAGQYKMVIEVTRRILFVVQQQLLREGKVFEIGKKVSKHKRLMGVTVFWFEQMKKWKLGVQEKAPLIEGVNERVKRCEICSRKAPVTRHHLIPSMFREQTDCMLICRECHDFLHMSFSPIEMRDMLNTSEKLSNHVAVQEWGKRIEGVPYVGHVRNNPILQGIIRNRRWTQEALVRERSGRVVQESLLEGVICGQVQPLVIAESGGRVGFVEGELPLPISLDILRFGGILDRSEDLNRLDESLIRVVGELILPYLVAKRGVYPLNREFLFEQVGFSFERIFHFDSLWKRDPLWAMGAFSREMFKVFPVLSFFRMESFWESPLFRIRGVSSEGCDHSRSFCHCGVQVQLMDAFSQSFEFIIYNKNALRQFLQMMVVFCGSFDCPGAGELVDVSMSSVEVLLRLHVGIRTTFGRVPQTSPYGDTFEQLKISGYTVRAHSFLWKELK